MQTPLQDVETRLKRWHTRLKRASNEVAKLEKKRRRLMLEGQKPVTPVKATKPTSIATDVPLPELDALFQPEPKPVQDIRADEVPDFLKRTAVQPKEPEPKIGWVFPEAKPKEIDKRTAKRLAKNDLKRRGPSRFSSTDMPLSGKDAMKLLRKKK